MCTYKNNNKGTYLLETQQTFKCVLSVPCNLCVHTKIIINDHIYFKLKPKPKSRHSYHRYRFEDCSNETDNAIISRLVMT